MRPLITLTTDFGTGSGYVAQIKGVILSICPEAEIIDVSHAVQPQGIRPGAVLLADVTPRFPPGTIHVAVVDPGVGTSRRILYAEIGEQRYVCPDNGLLSYLTRTQKANLLIAVENPVYWLPQPSNTFHGRDILAPVAARLARGLEPSRLGPRVAQMQQLEWPLPERCGDLLLGRVLLIDSFGNIITNVDPQTLAALGPTQEMRIEIAGRRIHGVVSTYGAAAAGELIALFDSQGRLEIAHVGGNAAVLLGAGYATPVLVSREARSDEAPPLAQVPFPG